MMTIPPGIIICNDDLSSNVQDMIVRQLYIDQVVDGYTFDSYVVADPNYVTKIKQVNKRILVVRTFADRATVTTWELADVVCFVKAGLIAKLTGKNKKGAPGPTIQIVDLTWAWLLKPVGPTKQNCHKYNHDFDDIDRKNKNYGH